jgi:hypothetical protein
MAAVAPMFGGVEGLGIVDRGSTEPAPCKLEPGCAMACVNDAYHVSCQIHLILSHESVVVLELGSALPIPD